MSRTSPYKWLNQQIAAPCPPYTLCTSPDMFDKVIHELGWEQVDWLVPGSFASTHVGAGGVSVVCIKPGTRQAEAIGLLTHEAVHVWRAYMKEIGEDSPSEEFSAYGLQSLTKNLWQECQRQKRARKK